MDDSRLAERLARCEPARAALASVLPAVPEEQAIENLIVLVAATDLERIEAEAGKQVSRLPFEVAAFQRVLVVVDLALVGDRRIDAAAGERKHATDASRERAVLARVVDTIETDLVGGLEPFVSLIDGSGGPPSAEAGVTLGKPDQLHVERRP